MVKLAATAGGLTLAAVLLRRRPGVSRPRTAAWAVGLGLALAALTAAAPLRWYL